MNQMRREQIRVLIEENQVVTIQQLRQMYPNLSLMTIHRDLDTLAREGVLVKFRGGARAVRHTGDPEFNVRLGENNDGKLAVAQKALTLIQPHSSVFLDAGTTNLFLARSMPDVHVNIFTTAPSIALELCRLNNPVVTLCGGTVNRKNLAVSGQNTLQMLEKLHIDLAFIGVSGCSAEAGFTCGTEADMVVKQLMLEKARRSVIMCTREKLSCLMPYTFGKLEDADYLISDLPLPEDFVRTAESVNVKIM